MHIPRTVLQSRGPPGKHLHVLALQRVLCVISDTARLTKRRGLGSASSADESMRTHGMLLTVKLLWVCR